MRPQPTCFFSKNQNPKELLSFITNCACVLELTWLYKTNWNIIIVDAKPSSSANPSYLIISDLPCITLGFSNEVATARATRLYSTPEASSGSVESSDFLISPTSYVTSAEYVTCPPSALFGVASVVDEYCIFISRNLVSIAWVLLTSHLLISSASEFMLFVDAKPWICIINRQ